MEYRDLERDFVSRTLQLLRQYDDFVRPAVTEEESLEETLLINCLVGLLVLPKERWHDRTHALPSALADWGLPTDTVISWGSCHSCGKEADATLSEFLRRLRNAVCHIRFEPQAREGRIAAWRFTDRNGFDAVLPAASLRTFICKRAHQLRAA